MRSERIRAVQEGMREHEIDLLLAGPSSDMRYLIGRVLPATERFNAVLVPRTGRATIVVPRLQVPLVDNLTGDLDLLIWDETEEPTRMTAAHIGQGGARTVAVSGHLWASFLLPLQAHLPSTTFTDAAAVLAPLRLCKDASEIAHLEDAAHRFDSVWTDFFSNVRVIGSTEREIAQRLSEIARDHGFDSLAWCDVGSGPNGASPLHHWSDRRVEPGDPIVIDFAAMRNGYFTDTCRTPVAGEPDPEFLEIYDVVNCAHEAAAAAIRPGAVAAEIDAAARKVIADAGFGDYFIHRVGHGLGIDAHEEPYLVSGNELRLAPGMVFSNEPGIYIPGRWGVRIENIMVVTNDAGRSLNRLGRELVVLE
jgi:Xaa-Pro aminopeptidase